MNRNRSGLALLLIFVAAMPCLAQKWPDDKCEKTPKQFEKQYRDVLRTYRKGDEVAMKAAVDDFSIPSDWFATHFGAVQGADLQKEYANLFIYFEWDTLRRFHWIDKADESKIEAEVCNWHPPNPPAAPAPASLVSLPDARMFVTKYTKLQGTFEAFGRADRPAHAVNWGNLYAEIDGKYRFFGLGGYPFWDLPTGVLADTCAKPGEKTGGGLVKRVEPDYPEAARAAGKQGIVRMRLTVSKDGSVTKVEAFEGDPALVPAAKAAAMQWRYTPWMNCGQPLEVRTIVQVTFPPPG